MFEDITHCYFCSRRANTIAVQAKFYIVFFLVSDMHRQPRWACSPKSSGLDLPKHSTGVIVTLAAMKPGISIHG